MSHRLTTYHGIAVRLEENLPYSFNWNDQTWTIDTVEKRRSVRPWSRHRRAGSERGLETTAPQPNDGLPDVTVLRGIHPA